MKFIGSLILAGLAALAVVFSVNNLQTTTLDPWPFAEPVAVPTYLVVLLALLVGFIVGAASVWVAGLPARRRAAKQRRASAKMRTELDHLRGRQGAASTAVAPLAAAAAASPSRSSPQSSSQSSPQSAPQETVAR